MINSSAGTDTTVSIGSNEKKSVHDAKAILRDLWVKLAEVLECTERMNEQTANIAYRFCQGRSKVVKSRRSMDVVISELAVLRNGIAQLGIAESSSHCKYGQWLTGVQDQVAQLATNQGQVENLKACEELLGELLELVNQCRDLVLEADLRFRDAKKVLHSLLKLPNLVKTP